MSKIITSLMKLIGRIKIIMSNSVYWLTVAMMVIPLSWVLMIWGFDKGDMQPITWGLVMIILGSIFWGIALRNLKKERKEEKERQDKIDSQHVKNIEALDRIINELKGMEKTRGGQNEQPKS